MSKLTATDVSFLKGLIAGEGCFMISLYKSKSCTSGVQVRPEFKIKMVENGKILETLCDKTGLGGVYDKPAKNPKHRDAKSWRIRRQEECDALIEILDRPERDSLEFLLGLISAEGCFKISLRKSEDCTCAVEVRPELSIEMVEGGEVLEILCERTGLGDVYDRPKRNPKWRGTKLWQIRGQKDCDKLIDMVEKGEESLFWETDKGQVFKEWKRAIEIKKNSDTSNPEDIKEMIHISKNLNPGDAGRSAEEWCAIVDSAMEDSNEQPVRA